MLCLAGKGKTVFEDLCDLKQQAQHFLNVLQAARSSPAPAPDRSCGVDVQAADDESAAVQMAELIVKVHRYAPLPPAHPVMRGLKVPTELSCKAKQTLVEGSRLICLQRFGIVMRAGHRQVQSLQPKQKERAAAACRSGVASSGNDEQYAAAMRSMQVRSSAPHALPAFSRFRGLLSRVRGIRCQSSAYRQSLLSLVQRISTFLQPLLVVGHTTEWWQTARA